jgi:DNA-binding transcriptional MerR regulator
MDTRINLMNQQDVAKMLKVSTKTLEYWRCKGIGPKFIKVGKLARYLESDLREFIMKLSQGGKP